MSAPPIKVLVVDDEPPIRKLLRMGLGTQGYQIIDAPNAKAALELVADDPDLGINSGCGTRARFVGGMTLSRYPVEQPGSL